MTRLYIIASLLFSIPFIINFYSPSDHQHFHTQEEKKAWTLMLDTIPDGYNGLFLLSNTCIECHGFDTLGVASVDPAGNDINLVDDWRATMMANSAKDPFWRAKVSHETLIFPTHKAEIETKCTSCHAPLGHYSALHNGHTQYLIDDLKVDSFGLDGVSCLACHQQSEEALGDLNSGFINFDTAKVAYGPFTSPLESPMLMSTNFKPVFSEHISDAGICAGCHTLITETIDFEGNLTGNRFVEQATYHEWLNSSYNTGEIKTTCQNCHMPEINKGNFILITGHETEPRDRFYLHELTGANTFMLNLMKNNIEELGINATVGNFEEVIEKTTNLLKFETLKMELETLDRTPDTAFFALSLENLAGHKFPSGYPSRRAFVEFLVKNEAGDTLFISGKTDNNFAIIDEAPNYEPHYTVINSESQAQIYEMVAGDLNGDFTSVLERAAYMLKDNRLPPLGFNSQTAVYDTTKIVGKALTDDNFNKIEQEEGTGKDIIYYHIPLNGNLEALDISAKVFYQSLPPRWMEEIFAESTPEIEVFREMFNATDGTPLMMIEKSTQLDMLVATKELETTTNWVQIYPTITTNGTVQVISQALHQVEIYNIQGKLMEQYSNRQGSYELNLKNSDKMLILCFRNDKNESITKIIVND